MDKNIERNWAVESEMTSATFEKKTMLEVIWR